VTVRRHAGPCGSDDSGAVAIIVAMLAIVLFGFGALVVDVGNAFNVREQAQHAVDIAARAGVRQLVADPSTVDPALLEQTVEQYVSDNIPINASDWAPPACAGDAGALAEPVPGTECISYRLPRDSGGGAAYEVRVQMPRRQVPVTLAGIFGVGSIGVAPLAAAGEGVVTSPCEPCNPVLDPNTEQPVAPAVLPDKVKALLPDPSTFPSENDPPPDDGCPVPGLYRNQVIKTDHSCELPPGLYIFDKSSLIVGGDLTAPVQPDPVVNADEGVTLVFYGSGPGSRVAFSVSGDLTLTATAPSAGRFEGEIPGVALVIGTEPGDSPPSPLPWFELGPSFQITGSVFAVNGEWRTNAGDCPATAAVLCRVDAAIAGTAPYPDDNDGVLRVAQTSFDAGVPRVTTNRPPTPPADNAVRLVQ
jgi:hypothetical protein